MIEGLREPVAPSAMKLGVEPAIDQGQDDGGKKYDYTADSEDSQMAAVGETAKQIEHARMAVFVDHDLQAGVVIRMAEVELLDALRGNEHVGHGDIHAAITRHADQLRQGGRHD